MHNCKRSETIDAITDFLFIGKPLPELGLYNLVIVLGNDDITGTIKELQSIHSTGHLSDNCHIILSGNVGSLNQGKRPEAERLFEEALSVGMPADLFWIENQATNALENYLFSKKIIEEHGGFKSFKSILCIGKAFMMRRSKMAAVACGYPAERLDFFGTVDRAGRNIGADTWWQSDDAQKRVMEELGRISTYTLKGDISIF